MVALAPYIGSKAKVTSQHVVLVCGLWLELMLRGYVELELYGDSANACNVSVFFFSSRRRHTRLQGDWSSDVCSSDLLHKPGEPIREVYFPGGGFCSMLTVLEDGGMVEIATVGREGMVGVSAVLDGKIGRASCRERV